MPAPSADAALQDQLTATRAELDGDSWVLNGDKWFTTGADGSSLCIVMAVTDPDAAVHKRASMLLVPTDTAGYALVRNTPIMGHSRVDLFSHGEIRFKDCRVPRSCSRRGRR